MEFWLSAGGVVCNYACKPKGNCGLIKTPNWFIIFIHKFLKTLNIIVGLGTDLFKMAENDGKEVLGEGRIIIKDY